MIKQFLIHTFILCLAVQAEAQDLSSLGKNQPIRLNGGISTNNIVYFNETSHSYQKPYSYVYSGNLNVQLYGIAMPFSFTYSNKEFGYSQPFNFNQVSASPSYKWIKGYFGYTTMNFSPYSLSGHQFLGAGVEVSPPNTIFTFSAMYGRFLKAVREDTTDSRVSPSFRRMGYGFRVKAKKDNKEITAILFKSDDDPSSLPFRFYEQAILPQSNLIVNLLGSFEFLENFRFRFDLGNSSVVHKRNAFSTRSEELSGNTTHNDFQHAIKTGITYALETGNVGLNYERVEPEYQTFGAYYLNDDFENYTVVINKRFWNGKLNLSLNAGLEQNNLNNEKLNSSQRTVSSVNVSLSPKPGMNINGAYSNFTAYTHIETPFEQINTTNPYENLDTLSFTQLSQTASLQTSFVLGDITNKKKRQQLMASMNYQSASSKQTTKSNYAGTRFYNMNVAYSYSIMPINLSVNVAFNSSYNDLQEAADRIQLGPTTSVSKSFFEKRLKSVFSLSYNTLLENQKSINKIIAIRFNNHYSIKKQHKINFTMASLYKNLRIRENHKKWNLTCTLNYRYMFKY